MKKILFGTLLSAGIALAALGLSTGTAQAFDPQPDPPGETTSAPRLNPGVMRGFNPQPEPPTGRQLSTAK
jgi:hypothetical protein